MIKVSTITPCYKMGRYLKLFLDELPKQTIFNSLEIVLDHNDPPEDEIRLVKQFQEKYPGRLKHIITTPVVPIGISMNKCIKESAGQYLAIWNVDDLRVDNSLELQVNLIEKGFDVSFGNFVVVGNFGSKTGLSIDHTPYVYDVKEFERSMLLGPFFMFKKSLLEKSGLFDEQLVSGADFDLAIRLAKNGIIGFIPEVLGYYLNEGKGASTNGNGNQEIEKTLIELRYGIEDKINRNLVDIASKRYDAKHLVLGDEKFNVTNFTNKQEDI